MVLPAAGRWGSTRSVASRHPRGGHGAVAAALGPLLPSRSSPQPERPWPAFGSCSHPSKAWLRSWSSTKKSHFRPWPEEGNITSSKTPRGRAASAEAEILVRSREGGAAESQSDRILERLGLEGTSEDQLVQSPFTEQGRSQLSQVAENPVQADLERFQGWSSYSISGATCAGVSPPSS